MTQRTTKGTFAPGHSGNPKGRPPDSGSARQIRARLAEDAEEVLATVLAAAKRGDMTAARIVLDRLCPPMKPTAAPVSVQLPEGAGLAGTARAFVEAAADGALPPDVAGQLVQAVAHLARVTEIDEIERRLAALEDAQQ